MAIQVTCAKCLKRFQVSDKFAGKKGPCPACKAIITVPDKSQEVKIEEPEEVGPKDSKGRSVLKPITRKDTAWTRRHTIITVVSTIVVLMFAVAARTLMPGGVPGWAVAIAAVALAPPLVRGGYAFAYDRELEPYRGVELRNRVLIAGGLMALLWAIYAFVPVYVADLESPSEMSAMAGGIMLCIVLGLGAMIAVAAFELELTSGLVVAATYIVATGGLALLAGVPLADLNG